MSKSYKMPICWLGEPTQQPTVVDGRVVMETIPVTEDMVNLNCHCPHPLAAHFCMEGHMTECHIGMTCEEAECSHYFREEQFEQDE